MLPMGTEVDSGEIDVVGGDRSLPKVRRMPIDRRKPRPSAKVCGREEFNCSSKRERAENRNRYL